MDSSANIVVLGLKDSWVLITSYPHVSVVHQIQRIASRLAESAILGSGIRSLNRRSFNTSRALQRSHCLNPILLKSRGGEHELKPRRMLSSQRIHLRTFHTRCRPSMR